MIAIGEVLWDLLPRGPVVGGAPANFAIHAHALGANASLVTCGGTDALGREILHKLEAAGFPTANEHANAIAAFVCSHLGAPPELPARLRAPFLTPA